MYWRGFLYSRLQRVWLNPISCRIYDWIKPDKHFGSRGELAANRYLRKQGYIILAEQYSNQFGEIDLIATRQKTIVIVEVKTRRSDQRGLPDEAVDAKKQTRISQTALVYLKRHELLQCKVRFDVISVLWPDDRKRPSIKHIVNAFEAVGKYQMHC